MTYYVEYHSNNSGGRWWMTDEDWHSLEEAGWHVNWAKDDEYMMKYAEPGETRYLGALATSAYLVANAGMTDPHRIMREAISMFDAVTSCRSTDLGCSCCGTPHSFTLYEGDPDGDHHHVESWSPEFPRSGGSYGY